VSNDNEEISIDDYYYMYLLARNIKEYGLAD